MLCAAAGICTVLYLIPMVECGLRAQTCVRILHWGGIDPIGVWGFVHGLVHGLVALAKLRAAVAVLSGYESMG